MPGTSGHATQEGPEADPASGRRQRIGISAGQPDLASGRAENDDWND